jgi:Peroxisomal membrane protein (Pex16)
MSQVVMKYNEFVMNNASNIGHLEGTLRSISYIMPGKNIKPQDG